MKWLKADERACSPPPTVTADTRQTLAAGWQPPDRTPRFTLALDKALL